MSNKAPKWFEEWNKEVYEKRRPAWFEEWNEKFSHEFSEFKQEMTEFKKDQLKFNNLLLSLPTIKKEITAIKDIK